MDDCILLDAGSGGRASQRLIADCFQRHFANPLLDRMDDAALLEMDMQGPLAMSTDSYTVTPLFFPGGSIGTLAVHGTVNDVSMLGARPRFLSCAFIIEEGLPVETLEHVVSDMAEAARHAGVLIVTGDTKVVQRGACDKIFINTTGIGVVTADPAPSGHNARPDGEHPRRRYGELLPCAAHLAVRRDRFRYLRRARRGLFHERRNDPQNQRHHQL